MRTEDSPLRKKSYAFALRIVKLFKYLKSEKKKFVLSKQILRSGTAIGALLSEAKFGQSKADFISKLSIALKEANETEYWLRLLSDSDYLDTKMYQSLSKDVNEIISMLVASLKHLKQQKNP